MSLVHLSPCSLCWYASKGAEGIDSRSQFSSLSARTVSTKRSARKPWKGRGLSNENRGHGVIRCVLGSGVSS